MICSNMSTRRQPCVGCQHKCCRRGARPQLECSSVRYNVQQVFKQVLCGWLHHQHLQRPRRHMLLLPPVTQAAATRGERQGAVGHLSSCSAAPACVPLPWLRWVGDQDGAVADCTPRIWSAECICKDMYLQGLVFKARLLLHAVAGRRAGSTG